MRKLYFTLLAAMALFTTATTVQAQKTFGMYGMAAHTVANDGTYAATSSEGYAYIILPDQDTCAYFGSEAKQYFVSKACNHYTMVGSINGIASLFTLTGVGEIEPQVTSLPIPVGYNATSTEARGASNDLSVVAGYISLLNADIMRAPFYWQMDENEDYHAYALPYPTVDFSGRYPQAIDALDVSADGSVIMGRFIDWTGFYSVPIVWRKNSSGNWDYQLVGESVVFTGGSVHLECPDESSLPERPNARKYMTDEEYAEYQTDSLMYDMTQEGTEPDITNYIKDEDAIIDYNQEVRAYNAAVTTYNEALSKYFADLKKATTGYTFESYSMFLSPDGKNVVTTAYTDNSAGILSYAYTFPTDTTQAAVRYTCSSDYDAVAYTADKNGNVYFVSNASTTDTRCTYVIKAGTDSCISILDYWKELTATKPYGEIDFTKMFTFATEFVADDGSHYFVDYTETGLIYQAADNADRFYGAVFDLSVGGWLTFFIDLAPTSSISSVKDANVLSICRGNESIDIEGGIQSVEVVDAAGHVVYSAGAVSSIPVSNMQQGLYIVRMKDVNGKVVAKKIIL